MAELDHAKAREYRDLYDSYNLAMSSPFGKALSEKLTHIDESSTRRAMDGNTPPEMPVVYEARGERRAASSVRTLFRDIEKNNEDAIKWLQANPQTEADASEK